MDGSLRDDLSLGSGRESDGKGGAPQIFPSLDPNAKEIVRVGTLVGSLWLEPNGVYRLDGRVVPVGHDSTKGVSSNDHGKPVVGVHGGDDMGVSLIGSKIGVDVE